MSGPTLPLLTTPASLYGGVESRNKFRQYAVNVVESCNDIYDIGTWVRILLGENGAEESCNRLHTLLALSLQGRTVHTSRACVSAGAVPALTHLTDLENNCRVCAYCPVRRRFQTCVL